MPLGRSFGGLAMAALIGALVAGAIATALYQALLVPLILQAEALEVARDHASDIWTPVTGFQRAAFTLTFNCLAGLGFGLMLSAAYALCGNVTARRGMLWGLAGFVSFSLAPALGLPPELPGVHAAGGLSSWLGSRCWRSLI